LGVTQEVTDGTWEKDQMTRDAEMRRKGGSNTTTSNPLHHEIQYADPSPTTLTTHVGGFGSTSITNRLGSKEQTDLVNNL